MKIPIPAGPITLAFCLGAFVAGAQSPSEQTAQRVFNFTQPENEQSFREMATVIDAIADIHNAIVDTAVRKLTIRGTAYQIALADWLFDQLDRPQNLTRHYSGTERCNARISNSGCQGQCRASVLPARYENCA